MDWQDTFFERLDNNYTNLTKKQKKLADYIMANYKAVVFMACVPLAREAGVSEATAVRLANALGYEGYTEMINHIREYMKNEITTVDKLKGFESAYKYSNVVTEITENNIKAIKSLQKIMLQDKLNEIVNDMADSKKLLLCGYESSAGPVDYFGYNMIRAGCEVEVITEKYGNLFGAINSADNTTFAIITAFPRYPNNMIKLGKMLFDKGAKVLVITDSVKSPLLEFGRYSFVIPSDGNGSSNIDMCAAVVTLFQILLFQYGLNNYNSTKESLDRLEDFNRYFEVFYKDKK